MRVYFRDDRKWKGHHWSREMKYRTLWMILFLFIIFSVYFLLPEKRTDHDRGTTSSELTKIEKTERNITLNITVRQSRQSGVARATCPD